MIKVENIKTHIIIPQGKSIHHDVLMADAKLVLVECKPEEAYLFQYLNTTNFVSIKMGHYVKGLGKYFKPILISLTEKIKVGDWYLANNTIFKADGVFYKDGRNNPNRPNQFKILALPEHFSPQQLQMIVDGKLKEGKCLVECEYTTSLPRLGDLKQLQASSLEPPAYIEGYSSIKLNPHITIYLVEEKPVPESELLKVKAELKKYKKAYEILNCYFDSISDEEQPKVARRLGKLGL